MCGMRHHELPRRLESRGRERHYSSKDTVFVLGDPALAVYFLLEGEVHLHRQGIDGTSVVLHRIRDPGWFAEAGLQAERYHCTATCQRPSRIRGVDAMSGVIRSGMRRSVVLRTRWNMTRPFLPLSEASRMQSHKPILTVLMFLFLPISGLAAPEDTREKVDMPEAMQEHMLANMRDHLAAIDAILAALGDEDFDTAAEVAEDRLGMSSLESHGARHMARVMPEPMRAIGTGMHRAASRFARVAEEGDALEAYRSLQSVTRNCVACHAGYRLR